MSQRPQNVGAKVPQYSFEEWKLYYESAEKVTDRRIALKSWNFSICIALFVGIAALANWAASHEPFRLIALAGIMLVAILGFVFSWLWVGQVIDYKKLNAAKFTVLNAMVPLVQFPDGCVSYEPFRREWDALKAADNRTAIRIPWLNTEALRSSNAELITPIAVMVAFLTTAAVVLLIAVTNFSTLKERALTFPASATTGQLNKVRVTSTEPAVSKGKP